MVELVVNINFKSTPKWKDFKKRSEHVSDRMMDRGIGISQIKEAVTRGAKKLMPDKTIHAEYKWYKVVYREFMLKDTKKVYPITVIEL